METDFDCIVVGAGPAGLSAALNLRQRGKTVLVVHSGETLLAKAEQVDNYLGMPGLSGKQMMERFTQHARDAGAVLRKGRAGNVMPFGGRFMVNLDGDILETGAVVLACGVSKAKPVPGEAELQGKGCGLNAARDATTYEGKSVYVIGGADGAVKEALYLARFARQVSIVCVEDELACIAEFRRKTAATPNIQVVPATRVGALHGADRVEALDLVSLADGRTRTVEDDGCGVFVYAGSEPNTALYAGELRLENGFIPTNERMETSISGVYAAGDIRAKQLRQVATAVSDGAIAAVNAATL